MKDRRFSFWQEDGFSLIEIALALVVIGLLTTGVMGGYSLIKKARLQRTATELTSLRMAVDMFFDRFGAWPGDLSEASVFLSKNIPGSGSGSSQDIRGGNQNGRVEGNPLEPWSEASLFWQHLSLSGFWQDRGFFETAEASPQKGVFVPKTSLGAGLFVQHHQKERLGLWVLIADPTNPKKAFLQPSEAQKLDSLLSNGDPLSGQVQARGDGGEAECLKNGTYNLAVKRPACLVYMRLDDQN